MRVATFCQVAEGRKNLLNKCLFVTCEFTMATAGVCANTDSTIAPCPLISRQYCLVEAADGCCKEAVLGRDDVERWWRKGMRLRGGGGKR